MSDEPVLRTPEEIYRNEVGEVSKALFDKIVKLAETSVALQEARKDRQAPPESISDAAMLFRSTEADVMATVSKLRDVHVKMLVSSDTS